MLLSGFVSVVSAAGEMVAGKFKSLFFRNIQEKSANPGILHSSTGVYVVISHKTARPPKPPPAPDCFLPLHLFLAFRALREHLL